MRTLVRTVSALALAVAAFAPAATASAKPAPKVKVAKWAKEHHLKGAWRLKDADRDGLANLDEYKLGTDPRKADTDGDGLRDGDEVKIGDDPRVADSDGDDVKDGAEHPGTVVAFDGTTVTIALFKGGRLTAELAPDADCQAADDAADGTADAADGDWTDNTGTDDSAPSSAADDQPEVDLGDDGSPAPDPAPADCAGAGLQTGALVRSVELERDGGDLWITAVELA